MFANRWIVGIGFWAAVLLGVAPAPGRTWTDRTGKFTVEASVFAANETTAVLEQTDHKLISVDIASLSDADQEFLRTSEATAEIERRAQNPQTWKLRTGVTINGRIVDYAQREVTIQRRRGYLYVNDRRVANLPEVYQRLLPKVASEAAQTTFDNIAALEKWIVARKGQPLRFTLEGVMMEFDNGDEFLVPFTFFGTEDLAVLQPGWEQWLAVHRASAEQNKANTTADEQQLLLQSAAQIYQQNREHAQRVEHLELGLLAAAAGVADIWVVNLVPGPSVAGRPVSVPVPARNSAAAASTALQKYPGYRVVTVGKISSNR